MLKCRWIAHFSSLNHHSKRFTLHATFTFSHTFIQVFSNKQHFLYTFTFRQEWYIRGSLGAIQYVLQYCKEIHSYILPNDKNSLTSANYSASLSLSWNPIGIPDVKQHLVGFKSHGQFAAGGSRRGSYGLYGPWNFRRVNTCRYNTTLAHVELRRKGKMAECPEKLSSFHIPLNKRSL